MTIKPHLFLLPVLLLIPGCSDAPQEAPPAPKVVVFEVARVKAPMDKPFNATLAAKETVAVRSQVGGYLKERRFEEGAKVNAGDVLFVLDDRDLAAALVAAQADTARARALRDNDATTAGRYKDLEAKGSVSVQDRDNRVAQADASQAAYESALAVEERARVNLEHATIVAPISGLASRSQVNVGDLVEPGGPALAEIYGTDPIRAEFSVTERELSRIREGLASQGEGPGEAVFRLETGDSRKPHPHPGKLEMADPVVGPDGTMGVRAEFPNPGHDLVPGMFATVIGSLGEQDALAVPEVAVFDQGDGKAVFLVDGNSALALAPVQIGRPLGEMRVIDKGLEAGQRVVVEGLVTARPGVTVEVVPGRGGE
jgi:membrane fusion protein (multidrug efflux system)